ncbi:hypothetical protein [Actinophytocola sp.]|uniref:hypothetical protein n=1 Tax=Actinophytocola sp. TaxID=1872138 RepID=UPI00389AB904
MAVPHSARAREVMRRLVGTERVEYSVLLREPYLPAGYQPVDPRANGQAWLWTDPPPGLVGGYGDPASYRLAPADAPLWLPPGHVLTETSAWPARDQHDYRRHSVDLTMRGGATSGVVYPLAVCEIATKFRVRNVGGASAGAIAAAATAAAELGRSSDLPDEAYAPLSAADRRAGLVRPGFVGLADTVGWLAQVSPDGAEPKRDEYRLAQLFRASPRDRRVFAVATAVMRQRVWAVPLVALLAFGRLSKLVIVLLALAGVALTAWLGTRLPSWPALDRPATGFGWAALGWGVLDLVLFLAAAGAVTVLVTRFTGGSDGRPKPPAWLAALSTVSSRDGAPGGRAATVWHPLAAVVVLATVVAAAVLGWWHWVASALAGSTLIALLSVVVGASVWWFVTHLRDRRFGLLATATPPSRRTLSEVLAGAVTPTVRAGLLPWLTDCFNRLAGLDEGQVLRFGHLWQGRDFRPIPDRGSTEDWLARTEKVRMLSENPRFRLVNLELVTTDLSRRRPYRFPLSWQEEQLYFQRADVDGLLGTDVVDAMVAGGEPTTVGTPDGQTVRLYRLPDPWNLPVAFAVQLSLAMPGLFKSVRLYRLVPGTTIRDDLGRAIAGPDGNELSTWPKDELRAEELWFSDGGITSNFPVHLFDVPLPRWPTFGLNLGEHPYGFPHQDVWLPQDWQATHPPATRLRSSALSFLSTVLDTARNWRDSMQTGMPGSRGRVAWVRQRPDEGDINLYTSRDIVASMALRGALAGARLSRRFGDDKQWDRHRWLRLRTAVNNMRDLHLETGRARPAYSDILTRGPAFLDDAEHAYPFDPHSPGVRWYRPRSARFWTAAEELLPHPPRDRDALAGDCPQPLPELKQTPPM